MFMSKEFGITKKDIDEIKKLGLEHRFNELELMTPTELNHEKVIKPWGYEYLFYQDREIAIWLLYIKPEAATSLHCHLHKETTMYVLQGNVEVSGIDRQINLKQNESLKISKKTFHKSYTKNGAYLFEIEKPNLKLDLLRLKDDYGRKDSNYESRKSYMKIRKNFDYIESSDVEEKNNFVKYIGNKKITIEQVGDLMKQKPIDLETSFIILENQDKNKIELKGSVVSSQEINNYKSIKAMRISNVGNIKSGSQYLSEKIGDKKILVFTAVGDLNIHLIESLARNEELEINILPSDAISMKSLSAYNKLSKIKGIFIPSTSYNTLTSISHLISNWLDSNHFNGIMVDADFYKKLISKKVKQGFNKGIPLKRLLKVSESKVLKIDNLNLWNRFRIHLFMEELKLNSTIVPKFLIAPINFYTNQFKLPSWNYEIFLEKIFTAILKYFRELNNLFLKIKLFSFYMRYKLALAKYKRPVILLGSGALVNYDSVLNFLQSIEKFRIPIFTTRSAIGILPNDSPNYYGRIGGYGSRIGNHIYNTADLILSIGVRFSSPLTTRNPENFNASAKKFIIDVESSELKKKHFKNASKYRMDSNKVLEYLSTKISENSRFFNHSEWTTNLKTVFDKHNPHTYYSQLERTNVYKFINDACLDFDENDFILVDGGEILHFVNQAAVVKANQKWINLSSLEEKNYALEAALGVYAYIEQNRRLKNCRIKVFCDESSIWNSQAALHYCNINNIPIDILLILNKNTRFSSHSHKFLYPHSYVARDSQGMHVDIDSVINQLHNFSSRILSEKKNNELNEIIKFEMSIEQEMNPRPSFEISKDGKWRTKPLNAMDPSEEEDSIIDVEMKAIINDYK